MKISRYRLIDVNNLQLGTDNINIVTKELNSIFSGVEDASSTIAINVDNKPMHLFRWRFRKIEDINNNINIL
jgi:hypothetical protein